MSTKLWRGRRFRVVLAVGIPAALLLAAAIPSGPTTGKVTPGPTIQGPTQGQVKQAAVKAAASQPWSVLSAPAASPDTQAYGKVTRQGDGTLAISGYGMTNVNDTFDVALQNCRTAQKYPLGTAEPNADGTFTFVSPGPAPPGFVTVQVVDANPSEIQPGTPLVPSLVGRVPGGHC